MADAIESSGDCAVLSNLVGAVVLLSKKDQLFAYSMPPKENPPFPIGEVANARG